MQLRTNLIFTKPEPHYAMLGGFCQKKKSKLHVPVQIIAYANQSCSSSFSRQYRNHNTVTELTVPDITTSFIVRNCYRLVSWTLDGQSNCKDTDALSSFICRFLPLSRFLFIEFATIQTVSLFSKMIIAIFDVSSFI